MISHTDDFLNNWNTQIRKGVLDYCIMKSLGTGEKYGYQIVKELENHPSLIIKEGIVYPILSKLKKSDLVVANLKDTGSGPARRYYHLTDKGKEALKKMAKDWSELNQSIDTI